MPDRHGESDDTAAIELVEAPAVAGTAELLRRRGSAGSPPASPGAWRDGDEAGTAGEPLSPGGFEAEHEPAAWGPSSALHVRPSVYLVALVAALVRRSAAALPVPPLYLALLMLSIRGRVVPSLPYRQLFAALFIICLC